MKTKLCQLVDRFPIRENYLMSTDPDIPDDDDTPSLADRIEFPDDCFL